MAQSGFTPISIYYSTTASAVPTAANLVQGELAINTNDGKLYYEDSSGVVRVLATKSTGTIGGSTTQVQYNSSGSLAGSANFIFNGTNVGIGVTPNANEFGNILQINQTILNDDNAGTNHLTKNAFYNSGWKYISTDFASKYTQASSVHSWYTAPSGTAGNAITFTQAMTLNASGNLLVGTSSTIGGKLQVLFDGTSGDGIGLKTNNATLDAVFIRFLNSAGSTAGNIYQNGTTTVNYATSSDYRLKENIVPMTGALAKIAQLKPVTYKWKSDGSDGQGFIAHELQEVVPDCVTGEKDAIDADGKPVYQGIDTSFLVATLTKAIQEQQALIESLTTRLTALENK